MKVIKIFLWDTENGKYYGVSESLAIRSKENAKTVRMKFKYDYINMFEMFAIYIDEILLNVNNFFPFHPLRVSWNESMNFSLS